VSSKPVPGRVVKGPDMEMFRINEDRAPEDRCVGTLAMVTRDRIAAPTAISWLMTDYSFLGPHEYVSRYIIQGHVLTAQRNECINRMDGEWIMFLDDDMTWQPSAVKDLVQTREKFNVDILGGLCFQRGTPYQPTLYMEARDGGNGYTYMERWPEDTAIEVDATGMAFVIIHRRVFDRILLHRTGETFPTREEREHMPPPPFFRWEGQYGEDFQFCRDARESGCRVFVDTSVKIGHIGEQTITERQFLEQVALRDDETQAIRGAQLGQLNLLPVEREEAKEKLGWVKSSTSPSSGTGRPRSSSSSKRRPKAGSGSTSTKTSG